MAGECDDRMVMVMRKAILFALVAMMMAGCEKVIAEYDDEDNGASAGDRDGNVVLVVRAGTVSTRAETVALSDVCGRLNVAVFDHDGKKVKTVSQVVSDAGFGTVSVSLADGDYQVVAVGHNGTGNATITSPDKVTFSNNKVTDTFCYYGDVSVTGNHQEFDIRLDRAVAMVRLKVDGETAKRNDVAQLKFYYIGGSSTLSPREGFGCVNSKQTEYRAWQDDGVYDVYTLPHSREDVITKMTVTAIDAGDNEIGECLIENVPVVVNKVTNCTGDLFGSGTGGVNIGIAVDAEWDGEIDYRF